MKFTYLNQRLFPLDLMLLEWIVTAHIWQRPYPFVEGDLLNCNYKTLYYHKLIEISRREPQFDWVHVKSSKKGQSGFFKMPDEWFITPTTAGLAKWHQLQIAKAKRECGA